MNKDIICEGEAALRCLRHPDLLAKVMYVTDLLLSLYRVNEKDPARRISSVDIEISHKQLHRLQQNTAFFLALRNPTLFAALEKNLSALMEKIQTELIPTLIRDFYRQKNAEMNTVVAAKRLQAQDATQQQLLLNDLVPITDNFRCDHVDFSESETAPCHQAPSAYQTFSAHDHSRIAPRLLGMGVMAGNDQWTCNKEKPSTHRQKFSEWMLEHILSRIRHFIATLS